MISVVQLGTIGYATGQTLQQKLVALRKEEKIGDVLLLLEHDSVITLGRNAKAANIIASPELLAQRGVKLFECDRGGEVTFHGPGQLVGYPIFDLRGYVSGAADTLAAELSTRRTPPATRKYLGAVEFIRRLEEVLIRTNADFNIETKRIPGLTGVWTNPEHVEEKADLSFRAEAKSLLSADAAPGSSSEAKLAAIGIHISRFVTSHGFALNVNPDLTCFDLIIPCGITTKPVTSMQRELKKKLDLNTVAESITRNFGVVFESQILWVETLDALLDGRVLVR